MTWEVLVEPPASPSGPGPNAPAPAFIVLATLTLVLMVVRHSLNVKAGRSRMSQSPDDPSSSESSSLPLEEVDRLDATLPLAVFLVGGDHALGPASVRIFGNLYSKEYRQILFVSVGVMDYAVIDSGSEGKGTFKGTEEAKRLKKKTRLALDPYLASVHQLGLKADCRVSIATNVVDEINTLTNEIAAIHPRAVYFVSKLVFQKSRWFHRFLHS